MTGFLIAAVALTLIAGLWIFLPLFKRGSQGRSLEHTQTNLDVLRDQLVELENDYRTGAIAAPEFAEAKSELERRTLEEAALHTTTAIKARSGQSGPSAVIWGVAGTLALLCLAGALYSAIGTPAAFDPKVAATEADAKPHDFSSEQMEEMLKTFAAKLENEPDNIEGWMTLARSYMQTGKYQQAAAIYEKIIARIPDEANVLADYADLIAVMQDGNLAGRPMELVARALKVDPTHWKALALAGTDAFERQDYQRAEEYWVRMKEKVPPSSEMAKSIDGSIAEARARAGKSPVTVAPQAAVAGSAVGMMVPDSVAGTVSLDTTFSGKVSPDDAILIFARRAEGSTTPIVLLRKTVRDLPIVFELNDSMVMMPGVSLATAGEVVIVARISKGGVAAPQAGDIEGVSAPVKVGAREIQVMLNTERK